MIFLVDASCYVFRAYHSILPDMRDRDGNSVHAVFGFARFLGDLIERMRPTYIAVAFDERCAASYRNRIYPAYKANRERAPTDLVAQLACCRELCRHLGAARFLKFVNAFKPGEDTKTPTTGTAFDAIGVSAESIDKKFRTWLK